MTMLERRATGTGPRWLLDGLPLPELFTLANLLQQQAEDIPAWLTSYGHEPAPITAQIGRSSWLARSHRRPGCAHPRRQHLKCP